MPRNETIDVALYADSLVLLLRASRWMSYGRPHARQLLCDVDLTHDQADEVIAYALARGLVMERNGALRPGARTSE